jgi:hypothetical protein
MEEFWYQLFIISSLQHLHLEYPSDHATLSIFPQPPISSPRQTNPHTISSSAANTARQTRTCAVTSPRIVYGLLAPRILTALTARCKSPSTVQVPSAPCIPQQCTSLHFRHLICPDLLFTSRHTCRDLLPLLFRNNRPMNRTGGGRFHSSPACICISRRSPRTESAGLGSSRRTLRADLGRPRRAVRDTMLRTRNEVGLRVGRRAE